MKEIFVRLDRCVGCHSCELACAVEHSTSKSILVAPGERPVPRKRLYTVHIEAQKVPLLCRHCENAPCVLACRTGALTQDAVTRLVSHDAEKCIGCGLCLFACPFGVMGFDWVSKVAHQCDLCAARLAEGKLPACAVTCPTEALAYGEYEAFTQGAKRRAALAMVRALPPRPAGD